MFALDSCHLFSRKTGIVFHHVFFSRRVNAALISLGKNKREFMLKDGELFRRQTGKWWKEISGLHVHHPNRKTGARNTDSGRELQYFYPLCRSLNPFCAKERAPLVYFNTSTLQTFRDPSHLWWYFARTLPVSISARSGLSPFQVEGNYPVQAAFCLAGLSFPLCDCIDLPPPSQHCVAAD